MYIEKNYVMKGLIVTLISLLFLHSAVAQETAERINYAHQYNPDEELVMKTISGLRPSGELEIMISLKHRDETGPLSYQFTFYGLNDYSSELESNTIEALSSKNIIALNNTSVYTFRFTPGLYRIIIAKVTSPVTGLSYYENIEPSENEFPSLLIKPGEIPVLDSYINEGRYDISAATPIAIDYYDHDFPYALPPMTTRSPEVSKTLTLTSSFDMDSTYDHIFDDAGLYVGKDNDKIRMVYRVEGPYFPEYVTIEDLIKPLVYITTRQERGELISNKEDKKSFDRFWLEMTGSKENARWIIKNYYQRVAEANRIFTTFKEGWKTDRGMLYIIFGPPDEVIRNGREEFWNYRSGEDLPSLTFRFRTVPSPYASRFYILSRDPALADDWMTAVKTWRKGRPINDM
jgi:GWxTD domain-containing protein